MTDRWPQFKRGQFVRNETHTLGIVIEQERNGVNVQWSNGDYGWIDCRKLSADGEQAPTTKE